MSELLPIGRFARACRLSIKALRHYDELGLLRPARVDVSGYRYYARAQARTAIAIALLRSLDVPLPIIKEVLASRAPETLVSLLAAERKRIERDVARSKQALFCVERIMRDGALMPYDVTIREEPARTVLAVEAATTREHHVKAGYALAARLRAALEALSLPLQAPVMCLLPDPPDEDTMILRMCAPLHDVTHHAHASMAKNARVDEAAANAVGAALERLEAGPFAFLTHRGPYEELGIAEHAIVAWLEEHARRPAGPMREIYVDDPEAIDSANRRTEVGIPLVP